MNRLLLLPCVLAFFACTTPSEPTRPTTVPSSTTLPGLFPLTVDGKTGQVWIDLPPADERGVHATFLYAEGLTTGLGSNPVGLDRGEMSGPWVVEFRSLGDKVLLERPNLAYRASTTNVDEQRATEESFATSVLWAGKAESDRDGVRVEITSLLVRDAHGVIGSLSGDGGSWQLDKDRSGVDPAACLAFPDNLALEARLTFTSRNPGRHVRATAPDSNAVTLTQHHSFIRLPDDGYTPRLHDPRSGAFSVGFQDYAAPLDGDLRTRFAVRHRLEKQSPRSPRSKPVEPIVYYVDRGAPEPVRSALIEGASWWAEAFEAAGFEDAYRVELLPEGVHPLDVRYNVIQWVHRSTRGWSYGNAMSDPRTGEIIKGHVSLGSLRVRQDRRLFEGLAGTEKTGTGLPDDPIQLSLARIRQLAAHEVGHTLGFAHNFTASTANRASVMDYPAPLIHVRPDGDLDFSQAYDVGIGEWDKVTVRWLYSEFSEEQEGDALDAILVEAADRGLRYHSDSDARAAGSAQPYANLWDNFADPITGLENALAVRRIALGRFGEHNLPTGQPRAELEEVLAPVYFHHRYQIDAAVKMLGGVDFDHVMAGDGAAPMAFVSAEQQARALEVLLSCLQPAELDLPDRVLDLLGPRPPGARRDREQFSGSTAPMFDSLGAANTAAEMVVSGILNPQRCARLVEQHRRDPNLPSLLSVLEDLTDAVFLDEALAARDTELRRNTQWVVVRGLIRLASNPSASFAVRTRAEGRLGRLLEEGHLSSPTDEQGFAHYQYLRFAIERYLGRRSTDESPLPAPPEAPPGSPIGTPLLFENLCGCGQH